MSPLLSLLALLACTATDPQPATPPTPEPPRVPAEAPAECGPSLLESCRLLAAYPLAQLEGEGQCTLCQGTRCMAPWPGPPGQVSCDLWAELERCTWQTARAQRLPDLPEVARENVVELQRRADLQEGCVPGPGGG